MDEGAAIAVDADRQQSRSAVVNALLGKVAASERKYEESNTQEHWAELVTLTQIAWPEPRSSLQVRTLSLLQAIRVELKQALRKQFEDSARVGECIAVILDALETGNSFRGLSWPSIARSVDGWSEAFHSCLYCVKSWSRALGDGGECTKFLPWLQVSSALLRYFRYACLSDHNAKNLLAIFVSKLFREVVEVRYALLCVEKRGAGDRQESTASGILALIDSIQEGILFHQDLISAWHTLSPSLPSEACRDHATKLGCPDRVYEVAERVTRPKPPSGKHILEVFAAMSSILKYSPGATLAEVHHVLKVYLRISKDVRPSSQVPEDTGHNDQVYNMVTHCTCIMCEALVCPIESTPSLVSVLEYQDRIISLIESSSIYTASNNDLNNALFCSFTFMNDTVMAVLSRALTTPQPLSGAQTVPLKVRALKFLSTLMGLDPIKLYPSEPSFDRLWHSILHWAPHPGELGESVAEDFQLIDETLFKMLTCFVSARLTLPAFAAVVRAVLRSRDFSWGEFKLFRGEKFLAAVAAAGQAVPRLHVADAIHDVLEYVAGKGLSVASHLSVNRASALSGMYRVFLGNLCIDGSNFSPVQRETELGLKNRITEQHQDTSPKKRKRHSVDTGGAPACVLLSGIRSSLYGILMQCAYYEGSPSDALLSWKFSESLQSSSARMNVLTTSKQSPIAQYSLEHRLSLAVEATARLHFLLSIDSSRIATSHLEDANTCLRSLLGEVHTCSSHVLREGEESDLEMLGPILGLLWRNVDLWLACTRQEDRQAFVRCTVVYSLAQKDLLEKRLADSSIFEVQALQDVWLCEVCRGMHELLRGIRALNAGQPWEDAAFEKVYLINSPYRPDLETLVSLEGRMDKYSTRCSSGWLTEESSLQLQKVKVLAQHIESMPRGFAGKLPSCKAAAFLVMVEQQLVHGLLQLNNEGNHALLVEAMASVRRSWTHLLYHANTYGRDLRATRPVKLSLNAKILPEWVFTVFRAASLHKGASSQTMRLPLDHLWEASCKSFGTLVGASFLNSSGWLSKGGSLRALRLSLEKRQGHALKYLQSSLSQGLPEGMCISLTVRSLRLGLGMASDLMKQLGPDLPDKAVLRLWKFSAGLEKVASRILGGLTVQHYLTGSSSSVVDNCVSDLFGALGHALSIRQFRIEHAGGTPPSRVPSSVRDIGSHLEAVCSVLMHRPSEEDLPARHRLSLLSYMSAATSFISWTERPERSFGCILALVLRLMLADLSGRNNCKRRRHGPSSTALRTCLSTLLRKANRPQVLLAVFVVEEFLSAHVPGEEIAQKAAAIEACKCILLAVHGKENKRVLRKRAGRLLSKLTGLVGSIDCSTRTDEKTGTLSCAGAQIVVGGLDLACMLLAREDIEVGPKVVASACALPSFLLTRFPTVASPAVWLEWVERLEGSCQVIGSVIHHRHEDARRAVSSIIHSLRCVQDAFGWLCRSGNALAQLESARILPKDMMRMRLNVAFQIQRFYMQFSGTPGAYGKYRASLIAAYLDSPVATPEQGLTIQEVNIVKQGIFEVLNKCSSLQLRQLWSSMENREKYRAAFIVLQQQFEASHKYTGKV
mmetsp:Transcript_1685/g.5915  ORF Transcript_1685/g.5915 Transcript_1685/m.5915 type:complete len:1571 (+) Transcript_1685:72-4784(+)